MRRAFNSFGNRLPRQLRAVREPWMTQPPLSVGFDLDNTLVDTMAESVARHQEFARRHRLRVPTGQAVRVAILTGGPHRAVFDRCHPDGTDRYQDYLAYKGPASGGRAMPMPGAIGLVRSLHQARMRIMVLSNRAGGSREAVRAAGFAESWFVSVLDLGDGLPPKPDPRFLRPLVADAAATGGAPVYVDDSLAGVSCALAAGARPVGVAWGEDERSRFRRLGVTAVVRHDALPDLPGLLADR